MLDTKGLSYSSCRGIPSFKDGPSPIMAGRITSHKLNKVGLSEDLGMESNKPANVDIETWVMTASTSKSATNLVTWH